MLADWGVSIRRACKVPPFDTSSYHYPQTPWASSCLGQPWPENTAYQAALTAVDTFSRFSPVIDPRFNYRSEHVVEALDRACSRLG